MQDARGDQCDKCGKLINATELKVINPIKSDANIHNVIASVSLQGVKSVPGLQ